MPTYTEKGIKFNILIEEKLANIRKEVIKNFPKFEEEDIVIILDIKNKMENLIRFVNIYEMKKMSQEEKFCPRCGESYLHYSLSRLDNKTKICGSCGNWEAMADLRFLSDLNSIEKINDNLNVLGTLKGIFDGTKDHEFRYFEKIEKLLNAKLESL